MGDNIFNETFPTFAPTFFDWAEYIKNWTDFDINTTDDNYTTDIDIYVDPPPVSHTEGYIIGFVCLVCLIIFVLTPAYYFDRRRHIEFLGDRREVRQRQRRRRRAIRRQRRRRRPPPEQPGDREEYILRTLVVTKILEDSEVDDCCAICLNEYKANEEVCWSKNRECQHEFHRTCLVPWLLKNNHCPCCRSNYLAEDIPNEKDDEEEEEEEDGDDNEEEGVIDSSRMESGQDSSEDESDPSHSSDVQDSNTIISV